MATSEATIRPTSTQAPQIEHLAEEAESHCELDPKGGPPVVIVNHQALSVITSTFDGPVFIAGVALTCESVAGVLGSLANMSDRYLNARNKLTKLSADIFKAWRWSILDGVAIALDQRDGRERERTICEERGHVIQHGIKRRADAFGCFYEELCDRREISPFVERMRGWKLYDADCKEQMVNEFAMKINNGTWREYGISTPDALAWITAYFCAIDQILGRDWLMKFRPILLGKVAKKAFCVAGGHL